MDYRYYTTIPQRLEKLPPFVRTRAFPSWKALFASRFPRAPSRFVEASLTKLSNMRALPHLLIAECAKPCVFKPLLKKAVSHISSNYCSGGRTLLRLEKTARPPQSDALRLDVQRDSQRTEQEPANRTREYISTHAGQKGVRHSFSPIGMGYANSVLGDLCQSYQRTCRHRSRISSHLSSGAGAHLSGPGIHFRNLDNIFLL